MPVRYTAKEHARRGIELYEREVKPHVEPQCDGKVAAIDVETGAYEVGDDAVTASEQLRARCPDAQTWLVRIGEGPLYHLMPRA